MNQCDFNHKTEQEVRLLPAGGDSNTIVCHHHYLVVMNERLLNVTAYNIPEEFPTWSSLKIYEGGK